MDGRADVRTATSLSKILGWMDNQIFLPMVLRYQSIKLLWLYLSLSAISTIEDTTFRPPLYTGRPLQLTES